MPAPTRTALEAYHERVGVCRDFAHLAIALCRCMNIPARYCTGYLGDIGVPPDPTPMDFSAWFEVYLGEHWHTFDARNNKPRIGRILIARGPRRRGYAAGPDFGPHMLRHFRCGWSSCRIDALRACPAKVDAGFTKRTCVSVKAPAARGSPSIRPCALR